MMLARRVLYNLSFQNESRLRNVVLAGSMPDTSDIGALDIIKRLKPHISPIEATVCSRQLMNVGRFLGDGLNNYVGDFSPEDLIAEKQKYGGDVSQIVINALQSGNKDFHCGVQFPEALDQLEKYGILTKKDFFKFANLFVEFNVQEAELALKLKEATQPKERYELRKAMVESNCDSTSVLYCACSHMFKPNPKVAEREELDIELLREQYPEVMKRGRLIQLSLGTFSAFNRIVREFVDGRVEPDPVIAILERKGQYTPKFQERIYDIAMDHLRDRTIDNKELPQELQEAIKENQAEVYYRTEELEGTLRGTIYKAFAAINEKGGSVNHAARCRVKETINDHVTNHAERVEAQRKAFGDAPPRRHG